jgi:hypothetical protein
MKSLITLLLFASFAAALPASPSSSNAGIVAAREMGLTSYVEFKRNGKTDSAALFHWRGNWWVYHPSFGSMKTALENKDSIPLVATLAIDGATGPLAWKPVGTKPMTAELKNGCLPRALAEVRKYGGAFVVTANHAQAVR